MQTLALTDAMIASGAVLALTFIAIFTEQVHGVERAKVAAAGAVLMIVVGQIFGFYSPQQAVAAIDWNVVFLLAAMMTIVAIMIPTGGFEWLASELAVLSGGNTFLTLVTTGTLEIRKILIAVCNDMQVSVSVQSRFDFGRSMPGLLQIGERRIDDARARAVEAA